MTTDTLQQALHVLRAAEQRSRACVAGSAAHAAALIDEELASKAVWDAAAGLRDDEQPPGEPAPRRR